MVQLSQSDLKRFLQGDVFVKFVARKYKCFIKNEDDMAEVRYKALLGVVGRYNEKYEYQDEKHLYSSVELIVWNSIRTMLGNKSLNKNNLPIVSECTISFDDEDGYNKYQLNAIADTKEYDNTLNWLESVAKNVLDAPQYEVFKMTLSGMTMKEIAKEFEWSYENVRRRLLVISRILKKHIDAEAGKIQPTMRSIRNNNKIKPVRTYTASQERRFSASDFLNP